MNHHTPLRFREKFHDFNRKHFHWVYGCYFPKTDRTVYENGSQKMPGKPKDVEWLDEQGEK